MSQTRAVIAGVNTYPGLPGRDLRGAEHDAVHWARFCTEHLRVPLDGTVLLTSNPDAAGEDLPGVRNGRASRALFVESVLELGQWIRAELDAGRQATGVVVFAGHGASATSATVAQGDKLALCLADAEITEEGSLQGAVGLRALDTALHALGVASRVTFIVDACYRTVTAEKVSPSPQLIAALTDPATEQATYHPRVRLLLGAGEWGVAYESSIDGRWRGVFSFALLTVLSQWTRSEQDGVVVIAGSYQEVLFRARALMQALGYDAQTPQLSGALRAPMVPFNLPTMDSGPDATSPVPNANRVSREISGEDDIPGIWSFDFGGGSGFQWCFTALLGGTVGSNPQTSMVTALENGGNPTVVHGGQFAMYSSAEINSAIPAATSCELLSQHAQLVGGEYQAELGSMAGAVIQSRHPDVQTHVVPWFGQTNSLGPNPTTGPAFGPYWATIATGNQSIQQQVWVQFHVSNGKVNGVQFWIQNNDPPNGSIQFQVNVGQVGGVFSPGAPATWFSSEVDTLIEV